MRILLLAAMLLGLATPAFAASLANTTIMTWDPGHGTQVEYYDGAGHSWLWYPGNRVVLPGQYKLKGADICFAYGPNSYNPVTGKIGGWECQNLKAEQQFTVDRTKGDVFHLKNAGKVPFRLSNARTTIGALLKAH